MAHFIVFIIEFIAIVIVCQIIIKILRSIHNSGKDLELVLTFALSSGMALMYIIIHFLP